MSNKKVSYALLLLACLLAFVLTVVTILTLHPAQDSIQMHFLGIVFVLSVYGISFSLYNLLIFGEV